MGIGRLILRVIVGGLFIGHGTQKLFGWFDGAGPAGTAGMMDAIGMRPGKVHALAAGVTETTSGALLAAGLGTPAAAAGITGVMTSAIAKVHLPKGPWNHNGGWEYNAVLIATVATLVDTGPGELSLDHALGIERRGPGWTLAALATGIGTALATMAVASRVPAPTENHGSATADVSDDSTDGPASGA